ncbi:hypothetical protein NMY22_g11270 [Coprinellus aureogranulatus]|nr:hypothetical protein NMY22_g11270 [Coprinellus aureogranulatus]
MSGRKQGRRGDSSPPSVSLVLFTHTLTHECVPRRPSAAPIPGDHYYKGFATRSSVGRPSKRKQVSNPFTIRRFGHLDIQIAVNDCTKLANIYELLFNRVPRLPRAQQTEYFGVSTQPNSKPTETRSARLSASFRDNDALRPSHERHQTLLNSLKRSFDDNNLYLLEKDCVHTEDDGLEGLHNLTPWAHAIHRSSPPYSSAEPLPRRGIRSLLARGSPGHGVHRGTLLSAIIGRETLGISVVVESDEESALGEPWLWFVIRRVIDPDASPSRLAAAITLDDSELFTTMIFIFIQTKIQYVSLSPGPRELPASGA